MKSLVQYIKESYEVLYKGTIIINTSDPEKACPTINDACQKALKKMKAQFTTQAYVHKNTVVIPVFSTHSDDAPYLQDTLKEFLPDVYVQSMEDDVDVEEFDS